MQEQVWQFRLPLCAILVSNVSICSLRTWLWHFFANRRDCPTPLAFSELLEISQTVASRLSATEDRGYARNAIVAHGRMFLSFLVPKANGEHIVPKHRPSVRDSKSSLR